MRNKDTNKKKDRAEIQSWQMMLVMVFTIMTIIILNLHSYVFGEIGAGIVNNGAFSTGADYR